MFNFMQTALAAEVVTSTATQPKGEWLVFLVIIAIIYFVVLRPQIKGTKKHSMFLANLEKGKMIVTNTGIIATISTIDEKAGTVKLQNVDGSNIVIKKEFIQDYWPDHKDNKEGMQEKIKEVGDEIAKSDVTKKIKEVGNEIAKSDVTKKIKEASKTIESNVSSKKSKKKNAKN